MLEIELLESQQIDGVSASGQTRCNPVLYKEVEQPMVEKPIGNEVHVLSNLISRVLDNSPTRLKIEDATGNNTWIIAYIAQRTGTDVFQRDLEKRFGITRSTASKVVGRMVKNGLIERQSIPEDARLKKLVLTKRAWEILSCMEAEFQAMENALLDGFTKEEIARLYDYIERMQENVKNMSAQRTQEDLCGKEEGVTRK